ncbi:hypothetical protein HYV82_05310 [Candidatus Woesearchaeota archaeon]|nr:hypothetical protein [Candidatus Woesearchaeota archaeon]
MIVKVQPDNQKTKALIAMARITLERLDKTDKEAYPSNTLIDYYDAMHKLMEAISLSEGVKVKGEGAHQELIDYVAKRHGFDEQTKQFLQQMRDYRNRISYEGFMVHKNYVVLNSKKISGIIEVLFKKLSVKS